VRSDKEASTAVGSLGRAFAFYQRHGIGVERFKAADRTSLAGWAYGAIYGSSRERTAAHVGWLHRYDHYRPHRSIGRQPPIRRLNNLLGTYT
jgi:hypothetical protein